MSPESICKVTIDSNGRFCGSSAGSSPAMYGCVAAAAGKMPGTSVGKMPCENWWWIWTGEVDHVWRGASLLLLHCQRLLALLTWLLML